MYYIGIDIGSTCAKTVVLDEDKNPVYKNLLPTGWSSVDTAAVIRKDLMEHGIHPENSRVIATGYGRVSVPYANKTVTEITCHGRGAAHLFKEKDLCVIDIGGQDTKIISLRNGMVDDFIMNDKCSAGTGRFLEIMANAIAYRPDELCELARSGGNTRISSLCTVFAESEVISLIGRGESKENIAFAVVSSIAEKVASQSKRMVSSKRKLCLTGGLCECRYLVEVLEQNLGLPIMTMPDSRYAGAYGAALCGM